MPNSESYVQKKLKEALETAFPEIYLRKIHQSMYSHNGIPDLLGCLNGHFFAVEVKTSNGIITKLQLRELRLIKEAGGIAMICYGKEGINEIIRVLESQAL